MNLRPTDYESVALPLSYTGSPMKLAFSGQLRGVSPLPSPNTPSSLDPELRQRLLEEARTPWRGLRRALWLAFTASAGLGLMTMAMRSASGSGLRPVIC